MTPGIPDGTPRTIHAGCPVVVTRDGRYTQLSIRLGSGDIGVEEAKLHQLSRYRYAILRSGKIVHRFSTSTHRAFAEYMAARWFREELMIPAEPVKVKTGRRRYGR